jgi:hypothetical protein
METLSQIPSKVNAADVWENASPAMRTVTTAENGRIVLAQDQALAALVMSAKGTSI